MNLKIPRSLFIILVIIAGFLIYLPSIDFQPMIAQGDHGRDLYAFERTLHGDQPFKDYWWVYGPLMPYYYAFFIKLFGTTIMTVLLAQSFLYITTGVFFFLTLAQIIYAPLAFLGAIWYFAFSPEFFYTYNHASAATLAMMTTFCLFKYMRSPKPILLLGGLLTSLFLALVKINFGFINLFCFTTSIWLIDFINNEGKSFYKKSFYQAAFFLIPLLITAIYAYFLWGLPIHAIRQCLPYLSADHPYHIPLATTIKVLISGMTFNATSSLVDKILALIVILSTIQTIYLLVSKKTESVTRKTIFLTGIVLMMFYFFNLHEYFASGVIYRSFWSKPFNFLLMFSVLGFALLKLQKLPRLCLYAALSFIIFVQITNHYRWIQSAKVPWQFFPSEHAKVFTTNNPRWINTVEQTTHFLKNNLKDDELFFALPYDDLYYYLTNKKSPSRQLIFFDHINIPSKQEETIIAELEKNHVNWVLISSHMKNYTEEGLGEFGKTYCPLLFKYIQENFTPVAESGDWANDPGWATNHGTRIYKRISTP